jgi:glycosyltransferase involved in cell wall biosynthesis
MTMPIVARHSASQPITEVTGSGVVRSGVHAGAKRAPKVLHITPSIGGGGAEAMLGNLVQAMHGGRWHSVVVAINGTAWPDRAAHLQRFTDDYYDLEASSFLKPSVWSQIRAIIHAEKPDIVQTWMHHADFVGGLCAWSCGVNRIVWGVHCREIHRNPGESAFRSAAFRKALALISRFVPDRIISCSAAAIEDHKGMGYPMKKMEWIPNGIRTDRFVPNAEAGVRRRAALEIPNDAPVVGFVGRFHEMKRLDWFFQAANQLLVRRPDAHFLLCGGTEADLNVEALAAFHSVTNRERIHFMPFQADVEHLYPSMSVFTLTSRTEACPMTVLEAMACGVPCVATDVGDCARLIDDPDAIVPLGDIPALVAAWSHAIHLDQTQRDALRLKFCIRAEQKFSIQQAARAYEATYEALISTPEV